jgi:transposase
VTVLPPPAPGCASCAARDERIAAQARELAGQAAAIRELKADMLALADEVRQLRRKLGRNSGNSSMPPSADDLPGRQAPVSKRERGKGGRKPGKQPGAPGSQLAWSEDPDEVVAHYPGGACGADLAAAADLGAAASHQVVDVPLETAKRVQHDLHEVACACGRVHRASSPAGTGAAGTVTYGVNLRALCMYLIAAHAVPVHRCAELIEALTGARPSPGFVHSILARAASAAAMANKTIRALIILACVVCADETPIRVGPGPKTASVTWWSPVPGCSPITCSVTGA